VNDGWNHGFLYGFFAMILLYEKQSRMNGRRRRREIAVAVEMDGMKIEQAS
jgi:hypothetical protein